MLAWFYTLTCVHVPSISPQPPYSTLACMCLPGVLFSSVTADNAVYCIIGYPSVQYTALHYWIQGVNGVHLR